jgi:hypothetical protein
MELTVNGQKLALMEGWKAIKNGDLFSLFRSSSATICEDTSNETLSQQAHSSTEDSFKISVEINSGAILELDVKESHMVASVIRILKESFPSHLGGFPASLLALRMSKSSVDHIDYLKTMADVRQQSDFPEGGTLYLSTPPSFLEWMYSNCRSWLSLSSTINNRNSAGSPQDPSSPLSSCTPSAMPNPPSRVARHI